MRSYVFVIPNSYILVTIRNAYNIFFFWSKAYNILDINIAFFIFMLVVHMREYASIFQNSLPFDIYHVVYHILHTTLQCKYLFSGTSL